MSKKKKTRKERSAENKAKWAEKRAAEKLDRDKKKAAKKKVIKKRVLKKAAPKRPAIETPEVQPTPWPRAGDNKEFKELLGDEPEQPAGAKGRAEESAAPEPGGLMKEDVAEWVNWPFELWSTSQSIAPIIQPDEALKIAEPLTCILNRHGITRFIPPDLLDGMKVVARSVPVVKRGHSMVKAERTRRANVGPSKEARARTPAPQGAPPTEPITV